MTEREGRDPDTPEEGVRVHDKRKIDPETGEVRPEARAVTTEPTQAQAGEEPAAGEIAELKADLQRVAAEYANYRKRVDRERDAVTQLAMAAVLSELLPALDDIDRAREHGELSDAFKAVADHLEGATAKLGLERFGDEGDPFDPLIHEALAHSDGEDLEGPTCAEIFQPGYRFRGKVVRPARVIVKE